MAEVGIEFTTEEILVLTELTGLQPPSGLGIDTFDDMPDAYRDYARESANRTLAARGVLADGVANHAVVSVLEAAASPALLAICSVEREGVVETTFHTVTPELGVTHTCPAPSVHRFSPFTPRELMVRLLRTADLRPSDAADVSEFTVEVDALESSVESVAAGRLEDAVSALVATGVPEPVSQAFCRAVLDLRGSASVTVLHKPTEESVEGGSLAWLDTGFSGLWVTEPEQGVENSEPVRVTVAPFSGERLAGELLGFLPEAFASSESLDD